MTVATETVLVTVLNPVAAQVVPCRFACYDEDEVLVVYGRAAQVATRGVDYTVMLHEDFTSFSVTITQSLVDKIDALIAADADEINQCVVRRWSDFIGNAETDSVRQSTFLKRELDRLTTYIQELRETAGRSVLLNRSHKGEYGFEIGEVVGGSVLQFTAGADGVQSGPSGTDISNAAANAAAAVQAATDATSALAQIQSVVPITNVDNIAAIRALGVGFQGKAIRALGHTSAGDLGGGLFYHDTVTSKSDDGALILVDTIGRKWRRDLSHGFVTPQMFGAFSSAANCGAEFHAAMTWAGQNFTPLWIPNTGPTDGGGVCRYNVDRTMPIYSFMKVFAPDHQNVEIRFNADVDGFVPVNPVGTLTASFRIEGFEVRGQAGTSSSATETAAFRLHNCRDFYIDVTTDNWVVGYVLNPEVGGFHTGIIKGEMYHVRFPNPNNGAPKAFMRIEKPDARNVQTMHVNELKMYSQLTAFNINDAVAASKEHDFTLLQPLYKATGIDVYKKVNDFFVLDTDWQLFDMTAGEPGVELLQSWTNPGDPSVATVTTPTDLRVTFGASWNVGDDFRITYFDPWCPCGVLLEGGSGNRFEGLKISGCEIGADVAGDDNFVEIKYIQCGAEGVHVRAGAEGTFVNIIETNSTVRDNYVVDEPIPNLVIGLNAGRTVHVELGALSMSGTSGAIVPKEGTATDALVTVKSKYPTRRKVDVSVPVEGDNTAGANIEIIVEILRQKNDGGFSVWHQERLNRPDNPLKETMAFSVIDAEIAGNVSGVADQFEYKVQVRNTILDGSVDVMNDGARKGFLSVTEMPGYAA